MKTAVGPMANELEKPENFQDYTIVTQERTQTLVNTLLRNFYNFLVTHPSLSESNQTLAEELRAALLDWENTSNKENIFVKNAATSHKQVSFFPDIVEQASVTASNAGENYVGTEKSEETSSRRRALR